MSKRLLVLGLVLGVAAYISLPSQAIGRHKRGGDCCDTGMVAYGGCGGCGPVAQAGPCCAPQQVAYTTQTITCYEQPWVERQVPCQIQRPVTRTVAENFTYQVQVPVRSTVPQQVMTCQTVAKQVPCSITELQQITVPEQRTETFCTTVNR